MSNLDVEVETLRSTTSPEKLVCQAARGDYYDGFVGEADYESLMEDVPYDEQQVDAVHDIAERVDRDDDGTVLSIHFGDSCETEDEDPHVVYRQYALLERLFRRGHWGPFEHPNCTLAMKNVSRSCMAQLTRHRHASFDVQSQRYVDFQDTNSEDLVKTPASLTDEDHFARDEGAVEIPGQADVRMLFEKNRTRMVDTYRELLDNGVPAEDARFILPIGSVVNMTMTVNARVLLHIEDMRKTGGAQWEIRGLTEQIHDEFVDWMPMTAHLYDEHGPHKLAP